MTPSTVATTADCPHFVCARTPRYSQRIDPESWPAGFLLEDGNDAHWSTRACGLACLRSVLAFHGKTDIPLFTLLREAVAAGFYTERGLLHAGLATMAVARGVSATAMAAPDLTHVSQLLHDTRAPLIASVTLQFPQDGRRGGHLVVVSALDDEPDPWICFRDPSTWGETNTRVPAARFAASYTGRVIAFG
ncbi:cysteine peptidase family C39 domain-containing protein [Kutzneria sp. CA-103260]|uniref:cysteine peptidase family C39 domain-containing protein n=1 Tax=Kutzneria sp. CA-103260 TaxID=2802641 RepID=UPI001BABE97E|nr:cysteine peptidase family C39 domain-containing protein [Kutzneria sp. CA-103260]QUQ64476.1 hypothetical protein JJ691_21960 [Kutzneria sp. CA-103260]